jgi:hypothetical protein
VKSTYIAGEFRGGLGGWMKLEMSLLETMGAHSAAARARRCSLQWRSAAAGEGAVRPEGEGCSERAQMARAKSVCGLRDVSHRRRRSVKGASGMRAPSSNYRAGESSPRVRLLENGGPGGTRWKRAQMAEETGAGQGSRAWKGWR